MQICLQKSLETLVVLVVMLVSRMVMMYGSSIDPPSSLYDYNVKEGRFKYSLQNECCVVLLFVQNITMQI